MRQDPEPVTCAPWLETIEGGSPILLIAPHGGHADGASRATLNPKVNDLYTAEITRDLAARLDACALINTAMDRNQLDLNRLAQVTAGAPWFLDEILERVGAIVARHRHAFVLLIHGWNVVQPRIDFGLGLQRVGGELRPPGSAHISGSDDFIQGLLGELNRDLRAQGIIADFGHRYPGAGAQNLLQAFTERHLKSHVPALRELSAIAARRDIDAVQFELSVALRLPGEFRERCTEALVRAFAAPAKSAPGESLSIVRSPPRKSGSRTTLPPSTASRRVGMELFDPASRIGAMASFDLGPGGIGARIMLLLPHSRAAIFTAEGNPCRETHRLALPSLSPPLSLDWSSGDLLLEFRGPAVVVPDAANYLSIERALASGWIDQSVEITVRMKPRDGGLDFERIFAPSKQAAPDSRAVSFGEITGRARIGGADVILSGMARGGFSFTEVGAQRFTSRKMIWACFPDAGSFAALELRAITTAAGENRSGQIVVGGHWNSCKVERVEIETPAARLPPIRLAAAFNAPGFHQAQITGEVENFIPLSRPGPGHARLLSTMGFARFRLGPYQGAGMFEYSRHADDIPAASAEEDNNED